MKVFQILEFNKFDTGSVHQMFQAATGLQERGHHMTIVSRPGEELESRAREHGIAFRGFPFRSQFDFLTLRGLRRLVRAERPDVIHVHKGIAHALALAATWHDRPGAFVVNRGVSFPLDLWNREKYRTRRVDRVITVCRQILDVVVSSGRLPEEKVEVVYAGSDVDRFDPRRWDPVEFRREKGIEEDRFLVAQVGVRDWKGWKELIDAVAELAPGHPRIHLVLIGCRKEEEFREVNRYAGERGMAGRVTAVEVRSDMPHVFASCDVVVDASWAGTGITGTIREAMSMEKPVIATDAGGNRELVSSPDVGWLIPMKNHAALTAALRDVISGPDRASATGRAAREHVVRGFSSEIRIARLEEIYERVLSRNRGQ